MSKFLEKYLEYQKLWGKYFWDEEEEKAYSLMEKADKECYPNFTKEDWEYLIKNTNLPEAKLGYKKEMEKYYRED